MGRTASRFTFRTRRPAAPYECLAALRGRSAPLTMKHTKPQPAPPFDPEPKYAGVVRAMRKFKAELDHTTAASTGAANPGVVRDAATGDSGAGSPRLQAPACKPCAGAVHDSKGERA